MEITTLLAILQLLIYSMCLHSVWMWGKQRGRRETWQEARKEVDLHRANVDDLIITLAEPYIEHWKEHNPEAYRKMLNMGYIKVSKEERDEKLH